MGTAEKNMEPVFAWRPGIGHVGGWVGGRGHLPNRPPSLEDAGDLRPATYHTASPLIPWSAFAAHLDLALDYEPTQWALATPEPLRAWLLDLPADELLMAHEQARKAR